MQRERPFYTLNKAEEFMNNVINVTSRSPRKFRPNYVHMMQEDALGIFNCIFKGNEYRQSPDIRREYQLKLQIHIKRLTRLLDGAQRVQCITSIEEADLAQQLTQLTNMVNGWINSKNI